MPASARLYNTSTTYLGNTPKTFARLACRSDQSTEAGSYDLCPCNVRWTSFAALQDALSRRGTGYLTYHVFDLLHLDGSDLTKLPLIEWKEALAALLGQLPAKGPIRYSDHVRGHRPEFVAQAGRFGLRDHLQA